MTSVVKEWDLNIFFREDWNEEDGTTWDNVLTINPVVWSKDEFGATNTDYTDMLIQTTFAEARYLRSQYPEKDYGMDWTDTLDNFMEIAPVRLKTLLATLPNAHDYKKIPSRDYSWDGDTLIR